MNPHALAALEFKGVRDQVRAQLASPPGEAAALAWGPRSEPDAVRLLVEETAQMRAFLQEGLDVNLSGLTLPDDILRKARPEGARLAPDEICAVRRLCLVNRLARTSLLPHAGRVPLLAGLARTLPGLHRLETEIDGVLDETGDFRDDASPELRRLRTSTSATRERVIDHYRALLAGQGADGIFQDDIIATRGGRYVLLVKAQARSRIPGVVLDRTESGQALYLEPQEAVEINNQLQELHGAEMAEQQRLMGVLTASVRQDGAALAQAAAVLGALDLVRARALFGLPRRHVRPAFSGSGEMLLREARHPLLESMEGRRVVPLDLELRGGERALIITGPNTGGKTVALKTIGLIALMAQAGLFIPAAEGSALPLFAEVYADIGDEQSLQQNLSTFSSHIRNIAQALRDAGGDSLVILDELGAGTDPAEGEPLAMAVVEYLLRRGVRVLATTHHSSLVAFAAGTPGVENASMEFDPLTLRPTYRLLMGIPGKSHAREVARQMGVPEAVIERSEEFQPGAHQMVADLVTDLDQRRRRQEEEAGELNARERELTRLIEERKEELETLRRGREEAVLAARGEALAMLARAGEEVQRILALAASRPDAARQQLHDLRREIDRELPQPRERLARPVRGSPRVGQRVSLAGLAAEGEVTAVDEEKGIARVDIRGKKVDLPYRSLEEPSGEKASRPAPRGSYDSNAAQPTSRLDIRGLRVDEAGTLVLQFLDQASLADLGWVEILHGKGEGRLKELVSRLAAAHPCVRESRSAPLERGGAGVTVINFK